MKSLIYKAHQIVASAEFHPDRDAWTRHARVARVGQQDAALEMADVDGCFQTEEKAEEEALGMAKNWVDQLVPDH